MPQRASDHSVPTSASANNAIGAAQAGRFSEAAKSPGSIVGSITTTSTTANMPTSEVDHGSEAASSTAKTSTVLIQAAGSRHRLDSQAPIGSAATVTPCLQAPYFLWR